MANWYRIDAIWYPLTIPLNAPFLVNFPENRGDSSFVYPSRAGGADPSIAGGKTIFFCGTRLMLLRPPTVAEVSGHGDP
jgi:hypothetical protein